MFAARGIAVSFSVFVIVYCALSVGVCLFWGRVWRQSRRYAAGRLADLLFALRMAPFMIAAFVTAFVAVPSFLLLEPPAIDEGVGMVPVILFLFGLTLGTLGIVKLGVAAHRASRAISAWTRGAQPFQAGSFAVLRISRQVPAMAAAGIVRPRILLSGAAESDLTSGELQAALQHEVAHVRRRDNLKKLLLRLVTFPGMSGLEGAWMAASEMAADDSAVSNRTEALDLASALLKLSRLTEASPATDLTTALLHGSAYALNARIARLVAWNEQNNRRSRKNPMWRGLAAAVASVACFGVTYSQLLIHMHAAMEWLVR